MTHTVFIDLDNHVATASATGTAAPDVPLKHLTKQTLAFAFHSSGTVSAVTGWSTGRVVIKATPTSDVLLLDTTLAATGSTTSTRYSAEWAAVDCDSAALRTLIGASVEQLDVFAEIQWTADSGTHAVAFPIQIVPAFNLPEDDPPDPTEAASWTWLKARLAAGSNITFTDNDTTQVRTIASSGGGGGGGGSTNWGDIGGTLSDQTDLQTALNNKQPLASALTTLSSATAAGLALMDDADAAAQRTTLGLGNVNNTSDANKPISTATQTALDAKVTGPASATDNAIARFDGTTGKVSQNSGITIADGTSGTLSGTNSGDVTLAGTPDYLTLSGQAITLGQIDLTTDVTGVLPIANIATGTPDGTKFVRDDGTLAVPPSGGGGGSGTVTSVAVSGSDGIEVDSGSPITAAGTIALGINASTLSTHLGLGNASTLNVGTTAGTVAAGDDSRLTDARTPTTHAASHVTGGSDAIQSATASQNGLATAAQITKLDGIKAGSDVTGPASATDNALVRFDGTTGKLVQNSGATVSDTGVITAPVLQSTPGNAAGAGVGGDGGSVDMRGGSGAEDGASSASGGNGGFILTAGGAAYVDDSLGYQFAGGTGGNINTAGGNASGTGAGAPGGAINTANGGGSIDTLAGTIELGPQGSRTTIQGNNSGDTSILLPPTEGTAGQFLSTDGAGNWDWSTPSGSGDVVGPASSVDADVALFDGTSGKLLEAVGFQSLLDTHFGSTQGAVIYRASSSWTALNPGTSGHVLTTGGAAANPSWTAPAGGFPAPNAETVLTDTFSTTARDGTFAAVTGLSASITPSTTAKKVRVEVFLSLGTSANNSSVCFRVMRGATPIGVGAATGNRSAITGAINFGANTTYLLSSAGAIIIDAPNTTSATTYSIEIMGTNGAAMTSWVNRPHVDENQGYSARGISYIRLYQTD